MRTCGFANMRWSLGTAVGVLLLVMGGCPRIFSPPTDANAPADANAPVSLEERIAAVVRIFPSSFHGQRNGKETFYSAPDGLGTRAGIPFSNLGCRKCHAATYANGTPVTASPDNPEARFPQQAVKCSEPASTRPTDGPRLADPPSAQAASFNHENGSLTLTPLPQARASCRPPAPRLRIEPNDGVISIRDGAAGS
jgi:hypothetical protein